MLYIILTGLLQLRWYNNYHPFIFSKLTTGYIGSQNETMLIANGMSKGSPIASYRASYASWLAG